MLDSLVDLAESCNAALEKHGFPAHPVEAYKVFVGDGVATLLERTIPAGKNDTATISAVAQSYREEYLKRWNEKTRPYAGIPELLDALVQRGMKLAVLSNKPDDFTRKCVTELLGKWQFDIVMGASAAFAVKPHPAGAQQVAAALGVAPGEVVYLGDTSTDMQTAVAAGMRPVGVLWGFRPASELREHGAQHLLVHPLDLLELLDGR